MRAVRIPLNSRLAPEEAVLCLRGEEHPFALVGDWAGGGTLLGSRPVRVARPDEDPFALLDDQPTVERGDAVVGGGWFGVLGYRLGELIERLPAGPPAPVSTPAHRLAFYDHVVRFDGERWWLEALGEDVAARHRDRWSALMSASAAPARFSVGPLSLRPPAEPGHLAAVEDCVRRIAEGELFQANLTLRLEGAFSGDAIDLFAHALARSRPRFGACLEGVVSLSPERFLRRIGRSVESDPIKGTADDPDALAASAKDAAEHVMIVDLMRNDLGRVCTYGSIRAAPPRQEAHANVWHLVSTVSGELRAGAGDADLLRATFPPGSVTGAPKVQAMKVIADLESTRREAYTGAIGYASPVAGLELSVTIRTFEVAGDRIWLGAGGGIVADSNPEAELTEALAKAAGPIAAVGADVPVGMRRKRRTRTMADVDRALEVAPGLRPDPALGLLETILVRGGEAPALAAHLARLAAGAHELYGIAPPEALAERIAAVTGDARVRVVLTPDGSATVDTHPLTTSRPKHGFAPLLLPGGLGAHKWADRRLLGAIAHAAGDRTPLLVDADGVVLETDRANVWIDEGGVLLTPRADGRILPGTTRAALIADGGEEADIELGRFLAAERVLLSSAIAGVRQIPSSAEYSRS